MGRGSGGCRALQEGPKGEPGRLCSPSSGDPRLQGAGALFWGRSCCGSGISSQGIKIPRVGTPPFSRRSPLTQPPPPWAGVVVALRLSRKPEWG